MSIFDKFFTKFAYKFDKGYPDMNNDQDVLLLESLISEAIDEKFSLEEANTSITEDLHEIFVAMFLADHEKIESKEKLLSYTEKDWTKLIKKLEKLENPKQHLDIILKYVNTSDPKKQNKIWDVYQDAQNLSKAIKTKLYSGGGLKSVSRVFGTGLDGKKLKGDVYVRQDVEGVKSDLVDISLKFEKGQFNSLSASKLLGILYNIPEDVLEGEGNGLLGQLYNKKTEYKNAIDGGVRDYLNFILDNYKQIPQGKLDVKHIKTLDDFDKSNKSNSITWPEWRKESVPIKTAFRKALASPPLTQLKGEKDQLEDSKRKAINRTLDDFLKDYEISTDQKDIQDMLIYILGASEKSYYYAAESGKKAFFIPSIKRIRSREYILDAKSSILKGGGESANYVVDIIVKDKESNKPLFMFDLYLRFAGQHGQYTSDISQKGKTFKVYDSWTDIYFGN
jgi:hypothetical protein